MNISYIAYFYFTRVKHGHDQARFCARCYMQKNTPNICRRFGGISCKQAFFKFYLLTHPYLKVPQKSLSKCSILLKIILDLGIDFQITFTRVINLILIYMSFKKLSGDMFGEENIRPFQCVTCMKNGRRGIRTRTLMYKT